MAWSWTEEVFQGDPADLGIRVQPSLLFSEERRLTSPRTPASGHPGFKSINEYGFVYEWPNQDQYKHKHRRWILNKWFVQGGVYIFNYITDDGMRVYIDNVLISPFQPSTISWKQQDKTTYNATGYIFAGQHEIRVEHYNHGDEAEAHFQYGILVKNKNDYKEEPVDDGDEDDEDEEDELPRDSLDGLIVVEPIRSQTNYRKKSLRPIPPDRIKVTNNSDKYTVHISLRCPDGVSFYPQLAHILFPGNSAVWDVLFDPVKVEEWSIGLYRATCVVDVTPISYGSPTDTGGTGGGGTDDEGDTGGGGGTGGGGTGGGGRDEDVPTDEIIELEA